MLPLRLLSRPRKSSWEGGSVALQLTGRRYQSFLNPLASLPTCLPAHVQAAYNGNRAPFPIYIRTPWLRTGQRLQGLQLFASASSACC